RAHAVVKRRRNRNASETYRLNGPNRLVVSACAEQIMIDRRQIFALVAGFAATPALAQTGMSRMTAYAFSFAALKGGDIRLADHAGKPILVVNTASQCGYTPQYAGLQQLWERYHERGLMILGVPSNDFGGQEPGGIGQIERAE